MTKEEIDRIAASIRQLSPETADIFLLVCPLVIERVPVKDVRDWAEGARQLLREYPASFELCGSYLTASSLFLTEKSRYYLESWIAQGLRLASYSVPIAVRFFDFTPEFVEHDTLSHVREWAERVVQIMLHSDRKPDMVLAYMEGSVQLLQYASFREMIKWSATALLIIQKSKRLAKAFFTISPPGISSLYQTERRKIYEIAGITVQAMPGKALEFYQAAPEQLLELNPNVRESLLDAVIKNTAEQPENAPYFFDEIVGGLKGLIFPAQELIMRNESVIREQSLDVKRAYFMNAGTLLRKANESFLPHWLERGLEISNHNEAAGIDYLSFTSEESQTELVRWKEAVFFDEYKNPLILFARALCGKELRLLTQDSVDKDNKPVARQYPATDDYSVYLPPYIAEENNRRGNFLFYKVSTAHQAGYIEFNTFDDRFSAIREYLQAFPHGEIALDIFFMLEDGRIDHKLRSEYAGLKIDLDEVLTRIFEKRAFPNQNPLLEIQEALLRLSVGHLDESRISPGLSGTVHQLKGALQGFYEYSESVWDCFLKTVQVYEILKPLLAQYAYVPMTPLGYRELPNMEILSSGGVGDDYYDKLRDGDEEPAGDGPPLSEEEIERLKELLKDAKVIEPLKKGKKDQGIYLSNMDAMMARTDDDPEEMPITERLPSRPVSAKNVEQKGPFYYDEWDYIQKTYRKKWCTLREITVQSEPTGLFSEIQNAYQDLIKKVKEQFQRIRPEEMNPMRRLEWGNEIDFNAMIESVVDRKVGDTPSDRIFARREKKLRRISTLLLVDMSASTDRKMSSVVSNGGDSAAASEDPPDSDKRIIDIERESLVVMTEALEALDDTYAIFGFSGYGREQVEFYNIKDFHESCSEAVKERICNIQPKKSTRMGTVIRHATAKLKPQESDHRLLILLSDGYPQDMNYGEDRTSQDYALYDTMMALIEAKRIGIRPFCITVDQCGDDYLRKISDPTSYLVIRDIEMLPHILPKVVESLMG